MTTERKSLDDALWAYSEMCNTHTLYEGDDPDLWVTIDSMNIDIRYDASDYRGALYRVWDAQGVDGLRRVVVAGVRAMLQQVQAELPQEADDYD